MLLFTPATKALTLSVGPTLQYYVFAYLNKDAASLYDSAYPKGIADFPSPSEWLAQGVVNWMAIPAILVAISSMKSLIFRDVLIRVVISTFAALALMDLVVEVASKSFTPDNTLINFTSDFTGAFLVGAILAGLSGLLFGLWKSSQPVIKRAKTTEEIRLPLS